MIKTIILDLDGPILDGRLRHYRCYADIMIEHGYNPIPINRYWDMKRNRINRHIYLAESDAESFYNNFLLNWLQRIEQKEYLALDLFQNGSFKTLTSWKSQGISLVLATMRHNSENLKWQLNQLNIITLFDEVIAIGNGDSGKVKAEHIISKVKNIKSLNAVWIGDTEVDVDAARYLGVDVCAVTCGLRTAEFLESLNPNYLETNLSSFAAKLQ
ncbi:MAG: HAD hydrolase-like protein [Desulfosalsimonadaceae bacterium]